MENFMTVKGKLSRLVVEKILNSIIKKKLGFDPSIKIEEITIDFKENGMLHVKFNAEGDISEKFLERSFL